MRYFNSLTYDEQLYVQGLINKGATLGLIYLWYNLTHNVYKFLPASVRQRDIDDMKAKYPNFETEIDKWTTYGNKNRN